MAFKRGAFVRQIPKPPIQGYVSAVKIDENDPDHVMVQVEHEVVDADGVTHTATSTFDVRGPNGPQVVELEPAPEPIVEDPVA